MKPSEELTYSAAALLDGAPCTVVLPAGCGKTELVAASSLLAVSRNQRVLVLTHTHAGVDALRRRLSRFGVARSAVRVTTSDSWARNIVRSFPVLAGHDATVPMEWSEVHTSCLRALNNPHIAGMVAQSYDYLIVDEYQDCSTTQHAIVMALSHHISTIILGDPMQAIYDFSGNELVDWERDLGHLPMVALDTYPWRWHGYNEALGEFLVYVRSQLERGDPIDLRGTPALKWCSDLPEPRRKLCYRMARADGSVVLLEEWDKQCEKTARSLGGLFGVMEDLEGNNLLSLARAADVGSPLKRAVAILDFARACYANLPTALKSKRDAMDAGSFPGFQQSSRLGPLLSTLRGGVEEPSPHAVTQSLQSVDALGATLFRYEAWYEMKRATRIWCEGGSDTLTEAVRLVRDRVRLLGRPAMGRTVSRPVLVKGLEYDRCVVLGADRFKREQLYVALTRARSQLVVVSAEPVLRP